jgi:RimJ/RimL family protein N-acetyltransferase
MRKPLLTERLILRDIAEADAELLLNLDSDPEVMRYIGPRPASDVASYRDRTRTVYMPWQSHPGHGCWIVLDRVNAEFLGWVFVRPATASKNAGEIGWTRPDEVEIGYRFRRSAWGRGIATEAATPLVHLALADSATKTVVACAQVGNLGSLKTVVACAQAGNLGSLRVLEKLGLERIGEVMLPDTSEPTVKLARLK